MTATHQEIETMTDEQLQELCLEERVQSVLKSISEKLKQPKPVCYVEMPADYMYGIEEYKTALAKSGWRFGDRLSVNFPEFLSAELYKELMKQSVQWLCTQLFDEHMELAIEAGLGRAREEAGI